MIHSQFGYLHFHFLAPNAIIRPYIGALVQKWTVITPVFHVKMILGFNV